MAASRPPILEILNPSVITTLLDNYIALRRNHWKSWSYYFESFVRDNAPAKNNIATLVNQMLYDKEFTRLDAKYNELEPWIVFLSTVGMYAHQEGQSLISSTLHAVRTYVLEKISVSNLNEQLIEYIKVLKETFQEHEKQILAAMCAGDSVDRVNYLKQQYEQELITLASLGDEDTIVYATFTGFFKELDRPDILGKSTKLNSAGLKLNSNIPLFFHSDYIYFHFTNFLRCTIYERTMPTFDQYVALAINSKQTRVTEYTQTGPDMISAIKSSFGTLFTHRTTPDALPPQPLPLPSSPSFGPTPSSSSDS